MTLEEMKNEIIHIYGFEAKETILFFEMCEDFSKKEGGMLYIELMYEHLIKKGA